MLHGLKDALRRTRRRLPAPDYPLSVSMTPAFFDPAHLLLRAQLKCLSNQTVKDFDVWLIDPHYQKRKSVIPELAARFNLDIKHIPYTPNTRIAKHYDCAIFNAAYCYSPSPINARYSCYRFVRPTWVERILSAPPNANLDFYMHAVGPDIIERLSGKGYDQQVSHHKVWNFQGEDINWSVTPTHSGYTDDTCHTFSNDPASSLANWPPFMDHSQFTPTLTPSNVYGNIAWHRDQWFALNGTNEVITNACHWEDLDFDTRAAIAKQTVVRYSHLLYRLHHTYGQHNQRSNLPTDTPFKPICPVCHAMVTCNGGDGDFGFCLRRRIKRGELDCIYKYRVWICRTCKLSGAVYDDLGLDYYFQHLQTLGISKAPILRDHLIGRNLALVAEQMDRSPNLATKVAIYNSTWTEPYYYST